jgi:hypothetical protein
MYARRAGDAQLGAHFKKQIDATPSLLRKQVLATFDPIAFAKLTHDQLTEQCLLAASDSTLEPSAARRYFAAIIDVCQSALTGTNANPATICRYVQARCQVDSQFDPLPDLKRVVSDAAFGDFYKTMLPFSTLSNINFRRRYPVLICGSELETNEAIQNRESLLGYRSVAGRGLEFYRWLRKQQSARDHLLLLETLRRWGVTLHDFCTVASEANPRNVKVLMALVAITRTLSSDPYRFHTAFLHADNPLFMSSEAIVWLTSGQRSLMLAMLQDRVNIAPYSKSARWWEVFKNGTRNVDNPLLLLQELVARGKSLDELYAVMQQNKLVNPQVALFWLDFLDADR